MSADRSDPYAARRDSDPAEQTVGDVIDNAVRKIVTAIVVAGGIVGLAVYFQAPPPRYQAAVGDGRVVRMDTRTGTIIACDAQGCAIVLRRGQRLEERSNLDRLPHQGSQNLQAPAVPAPALPAPATKAPAAQAPAAAPDEE
ncbi:MAG: hypothetical protein QOG13_3248 [Sphingomonadales bacterium]|jgi:hypothetical protein|nr:hypothetical protein [Sphingomonadales bacterium]MEA3042227.1 hypothetical protein [Sphingomonadales bacterium]